MIKICSIYGEKQSGKDSSCDAIKEKFDVVHLSFANKLKEICWMMYGKKIKKRARLWGEKEKEEYITGWPISENIRSKFGYEEVYWSGRRLLQWMGTDVGREAFDDVWIELFKDDLYALPDGTTVVITDNRFPNEYEMLKSMPKDEFEVFFVEVRRDVQQNRFSAHSSESHMKHFTPDIIIDNNSTLEDLHEVATTIFKTFL